MRRKQRHLVRRRGDHMATAQTAHPQGARALRLVLMSVLLALAAAPLLADQGLIAHYGCDEGAGAVLNDSVGGHDGAITGATWAKSGDGFALRFDGKKDFVDCGAGPGPSPMQAVTLEAWVYPERTPAAGEAGIVGKGYGTFVLTQYTDGQCWWYIGGGGNNAKAALAPGTWHHVVGTFDGQDLRLYMDGELAALAPSKVPTIPTGDHFYLGMKDGEGHPAATDYFQGMLDEVRLYDRAMSPEEVLDHYHTTKLTHTVEIVVYPYVASRQVAVQMDFKGLGTLPAGTVAKAELLRPGQARPLAAATTGPLQSWGQATVTLGADRLLPGDYQVRVTALSGGKAVGHAGVQGFVWPKPPTWPRQDPRVKVLNSLVSELGRLADVKAAVTRLRFPNPREGWVFFATEGASGAVGVALASDEAHPLIAPPATEAMRRLSAGEHELIVRCGAGARLRKLVVRAVPELGYCRVDSNVKYAPPGFDRWKFLERTVLPNVNLLVSSGNPELKPRWEAWRAEGKRWIVECPLPGLGKDNISADEVEKVWLERGNIKEPLLDGIIVDEFSGSDQPIWASWHEALKRLQANPDFRGKVFYPYCGPLHGAAASRAFAQTVLDAGWACALERYLPTPRTEGQARAELHQALVATPADWAQSQPEIVRHLMIVTGFFMATPYEFLNVDPGVDYKAFVDMQMHTLANEPGLFGLYGVYCYASGAADEELQRWVMRLYRHYCLEGRTDRLTTDYRLPYLTNGDFEDGLQSWSAEPAADGSITTGFEPGFGWLQGRYPEMTRGNRFLLLKRSQGAPNTVRQTLRQLQPKKLYSLRLISADLGDLRGGVSRQQTLPLTVTLDGVDLLPDRCCQLPYASCYSHDFGPFNARHPAWFNLHSLVFRARGREAVLTLSDGGKTDAGPGQQLAVNYVTVQPYFEGE